MRAVLSVRPKCSHRCVSLKESTLKPVLILKHAIRISTEQTSMSEMVLTYRKHSENLLNSKSETLMSFYRVFQGSALRGPQFDFIFAVLRSLVSCSKMSLSTLKPCTPSVKGTP